MILQIDTSRITQLSSCKPGFILLRSRGALHPRAFEVKSGVMKVTLCVG